MRTSIKSRLEQLENWAGMKGCLTVILRDLTENTLTGVVVHGETIERPAHEPERAFIDRVQNQHRNMMAPGERVLVIKEIRGRDV